MWKLQNSKYDLDLSPYDVKIKRGLLWVIGNICVKYHHGMSTMNRVIVRSGANSNSKFDIFPLPLNKKINRVPLSLGSCAASVK